MRIPQLKSLARDRGLRNYSWMRKAELVAVFDHLGWNYSPLCGVKPPSGAKPGPPIKPVRYHNFQGQGADPWALSMGNKILPIATFYLF